MDAPCSGSGLVIKETNSNAIYNADEQILVDEASLINGDDDSGEVGRRLHGYQTLQIALLLHAMSFRQVSTIVYSTSSTYRMENEDVVKKALSQCNGAWKLVKLFPEWPTRGLKAEKRDKTDYCIRTSQQKDLSNGFFIAKFTRVVTQPQEKEEEEGQLRDVKKTEQTVKHTTGHEEEEEEADAKKNRGTKRQRANEQDKETVNHEEEDDEEDEEQHQQKKKTKKTTRMQQKSSKKPAVAPRVRHNNQRPNKKRAPTHTTK